MSIAAFFNYLTPIIYWVLILTWTYIFFFYVKTIKTINKGDKLLRLLLIILAIDAFRSLAESAFFGAWYTSLSGLIPSTIFDFLAQPQIVFFPKVFNLITSFIILTILLRKWLRSEISQKQETSNLLDSQNSELIDKNSKLLEAKDKAVESELKLKTIIEQAPLGIGIIHSYTGKIRELNPMYSKITGRSIEEMKTIDWMSITHPDDIQADLDNMALMNAGKTKGFKMRKRYIHSTGKIVWINMTIAPLNLANETNPEHLCMIEDITDRRHAEKKIEKQLSELRKWHNATVDREDRIMDLKREVNELLVQEGKPVRYTSIASL